MKVFLIGLPGSGKSTLGVELAKLLHYDFIDTDDLIVKNEGMTINELFQQYGEAHFRKLEEKALKNLQKLERTIISTGGGLPCFFDNMDIILTQGFSIYLNVPPEIITERLYAVNDQTRPMVKGKSREEMLSFLQQKSEERTRFYQRANLEITEEASPEQVFEMLKKYNIV